MYLNDVVGLFFGRICSSSHWWSWLSLSMHVTCFQYRHVQGTTAWSCPTSGSAVRLATVQQCSKFLPHWMKQYIEYVDFWNALFSARLTLRTCEHMKMRAISTGKGRFFLGCLQQGNWWSRCRGVVSRQACLHLAPWQAGRPGVASLWSVFLLHTCKRDNQIHQLNSHVAFQAKEILYSLRSMTERRPWLVFPTNVIWPYLVVFSPGCTYMDFFFAVLCVWKCFNDFCFWCIQFPRSRFVVSDSAILDVTDFDCCLSLLIMMIISRQRLMITNKPGADGSLLWPAYWALYTAIL